MKSGIPTRRHAYLCRETIGVAKKLYDELNGSNIVELDTEFYDTFKKAYEEFQEEFSKKSFSPSKIQELYLSLRDATISVLVHYKGISPICRKYYLARLKFKKLEDDYVKFIADLTNSFIESSEFAVYDTHYRKLEEMIQTAQTPSREEFDKVAEELELCKQISEMP